MNTRNSVLASLTLAVIALVFFTLPLQQNTANAQTIVSQQTITLLDGETSYTTTMTTDEIFTTYYANLSLHISNDISGTGNITITPQISLQPVSCSTVSDWTTATVSGFDATGPEWETSEITMTVTNDDNQLISMPTAGRCMRLRIESATTFTPTVYVWMVNSSQ